MTFLIWKRKAGRWVIFCLIVLAPVLARADVDPHFQPLIVKLAEAGYNPVWLEEIFGRPCVALDPRVLLLRLTVKESQSKYDEFLEKAPLNKAQALLKKYDKAFKEAEKLFQVPPEIISAIFLLETSSGTDMGRYQTLTTLATHAAAEQPQVAGRIYRLLSPSDKKRWTKKAAAQHLNARAAWFFDELKAFLPYLKKTGADPCQVQGSYTGAIGICQFQPSNLTRHGRDGNRDGLVDLFQVEDAVFSAAAYLQNYGWGPNLSEKEKVEVLIQYNYSRPYAQTVLEAARRLKNGP